MAEDKIVELTIEDRIGLCMTDLLPVKGTYLSNRIRESIVLKTQPSIEELRNLGMKQTELQFKWDRGKAKEAEIKEISFIDMEVDFIAKHLQELEKPTPKDPHGRVEKIHQRLFELFTETKIDSRLLSNGHIKEPIAEKITN